MTGSKHSPTPTPRQLPLFGNRRGWGGARAGAGRPKGERSYVPHASRPPLASRFPVHVTVRMRDHCWNLRSQRCYRVLRRAFGAGCDRFGFRLTHYSVQGNHIHMVTEAVDAVALGRGLKGLGVRIARGLNRVMSRHGAVLAERYHAHILRTPREVRNALRYVLENAGRHAARWGRPLPADWIDPYASSTFEVHAPRGTPDAPAVVDPRTWLLRQGWHRHGLLGFV